MIKKNSKIYKDNIELKDNEDILSFLDEEFVLEDGFTVKNYFELFNNYGMLINLDLFIPSYLEEYEKVRNNDVSSTSLTKIIIRKVFEFFKDKLKSYVLVDGYSDSENQIFAIDFMELSDLIHLKIEIAKASIVYDDMSTKEFEYSLSFYNFIKSIIWELSFYGNPEQSRETRDLMLKSFREVEENFKPTRVLSGTSK